MKTSKAVLTTLLVIGASATLIVAQDKPQGGNRPSQGGGQQGGRPPQQQGGQQQQRPGSGNQSSQAQQGGQRPSFPLIEALDANRNHQIDADEIANATALLKKLDKNGDGKLTGEEFLPARSQGGRPPGGEQGQGERPRQQ